MAAKEYSLGKLGDFPEGKGKAFQAGRTTVAVFRANGKLFAINNRCVHKGASMCEGELTDGGKVVRCPWHNWAFDLTTGEHCYDRNEKIRTYEIKLDGDEVILCA
jgi:nitrite reductase/ring-hydroxylating ferredoxin subunit